MGLRAVDARKWPQTGFNCGTRASRRQHRETQATLQRSIADLTELLSLLDVFNRSRFQGDAGLLGMWTSLRTVGRALATRARRGNSSAASEVPATPQVIPPAAPPVNTPTRTAPTVNHGGDDEPPLDAGLNQVA